MGKNKLRKFDELGRFERVFQPRMEEIKGKDYPLKGLWKQEVFHNDHPLVLELGCGRGEYTVGMAKRFPEINFIGIDIKGARIWKGAKDSHEGKILNAAFLRTRIELIEAFFAPDEVHEIWITFPDPQPTERRKKKRLTSPGFLRLYQRFLIDGGIMHLKTDSDLLFQYTCAVLEFNKIEILTKGSEVFKTSDPYDVLNIKTYYELKFLDAGIPIKYLKFKLIKHSPIHEPPEKT